MRAGKYQMEISQSSIIASLLFMHAKESISRAMILLECTLEHRPRLSVWLWGPRQKLPSGGAIEMDHKARGSAYDSGVKVGTLV